MPVAPATHTDRNVANLALSLDFEHRLQYIRPGQLSGGRTVDLPDINIVHLDPVQTVFNIVPHVGSGPDVMGTFVTTLARNVAATFGGEIVFITPVGDELTNEILTGAVVGGGINKVDASLKHTFEH